MSSGSTKRFYSIINQNSLEPETDRRSRFSDTDIEVQYDAPESVFSLRPMYV